MLGKIRRVLSEQPGKQASKRYLMQRTRATIQQLINHADAAMFDAKRRGRNNWPAFTPALARKLTDRLLIETQLRRALDNQEFYLRYQPQVDLVSGKVTAAEALIRWRNPMLGELAPDLFISHAENTGDIVRIGTALAQVTGPRVPCANLARRIGRKDWVKLTIRENRTGFYMAVREPGIVQPGDPWHVEERFNPEGTIPAINRCLYLDFDPVFAHKNIVILFF